MFEEPKQELTEDSLFLDITEYLRLEKCLIPPVKDFLLL